MTKILLVDDEETFCQLLKMNLEALGRFEVFFVCDPRQALSCAIEYSPNAILLDLMMPHMEGSQVARQLKEEPKTSDIPIFFLTALSDGIQTEENAVPAVRGVISKPVMIADLVHQLDAVLGKGKSA